MKRRAVIVAPAGTRRDQWIRLCTEHVSRSGYVLIGIAEDAYDAAAILAVGCADVIVVASRAHAAVEVATPTGEAPARAAGRRPQPIGGTR